MLSHGQEDRGINLDAPAGFPVLLTLQIDDAITNLQGMYLHRLQIDRLLQLERNFPVVVLTGARQVGKTTLV